MGCSHALFIATLCVIITVLVASPYPEKRRRQKRQACASGMYTCDNGQCTMWQYVCNGIPGGCYDGSDETGCLTGGCDPNPCGTGEFCDEVPAGHQCRPPLPATCPAPDNVDHGTLTGPANLLEGATYTVTCGSGYEGDASRTCQSDGTWSGDEPVCTGINECDSSPCDPNASCEITDGMYFCTCTAGYEGNGFTCTAIDV